jgi:hypothetical protein
MNNSVTDLRPESQEVFSFHLVDLPIWKIPVFWWKPLGLKNIPGLKHAESFLSMSLGEPVISRSRYRLGCGGIFAYWESEAALDRFMAQAAPRLSKSWMVRLRLYRKWGGVSELNGSAITPSIHLAGDPVVAVTVARLKLSQLFRFIRYGKPVEQQVRDDSGQRLALAGLRLPRSFCTFSIWDNESEMLKMVNGKNQSHRLAMQERARKDFHTEFCTMRFVPIREAGSWRGKEAYTAR